jgi:glutamine amidotransferase
MKISMADYGVGNLYSIKNALENGGAEVEVVTDMEKLLGAECIVFPGVGAFDKTMEKLLPFREEIRKTLLSGVPALGICIGAQILFESSEEGTCPGLGLFDGKVTKLRAKCLPHMGWNTVGGEDPLFEGVDDRYFYFANSYYCSPKNENECVGKTVYDGFEFPSFFRKANTYGTQFHPEKSGVSGTKVVENFIKFAEELV